MVTIIPVTWNLDLIADLDFKQDYHKDLDLIGRYVNAGHDPGRMIIYNYWEPNPMPTAITDLKGWFPELDCVTLAIHRTPPGCYLPLHHDLYGRYRDTFTIEHHRSIVRAIIMLSHGEPGQIIQVDKETHGSWQAGQVFSWRDQTPHAIYNFSMHDRFAVQITGVLK
jgi:hypothetical protein